MTLSPNGSSLVGWNSWLDSAIRSCCNVWSTSTGTTFLFTRLFLGLSFFVSTWKGESTSGLNLSSAGSSVTSSSLKGENFAVISGEERSRMETKFSGDFLFLKLSRLFIDHLSNICLVSGEARPTRMFWVGDLSRFRSEEKEDFWRMPNPESGEILLSANKHMIVVDSKCYGKVGTEYQHSFKTCSNNRVLKRNKNTKNKIKTVFYTFGT